MKSKKRTSTIIGPALPNIPWEEKPVGYTYPVWRYSRNPIVPRDAIPLANSIYNSAVVPFGDGFAGVFRVDDINRGCGLHTGWSRDGLIRPHEGAGDNECQQVGCKE